MNKKITIKEHSFDETFESDKSKRLSKRKVVRVISIRFKDNSNRIEDINLRALSYIK